MTSPVERAIVRDGAPLGYRVSGRGRPLLLLHATLSSARQLAPLAGHLGPRFRVIAVDRRGSGSSGFPPGRPVVPLDVAVHLADLEAVLDAEGADRALVVAHSYGACVGLELAARRPGRVTGVWAYEPPFAPAGPPEVQALLADVARRTTEAVLAGGSPAAARAFLVALSGRDVTAELAPASRDRILAAGDSVVADGALTGLDVEGLRRIDAPVVLAGGSASQAFYEPIRAGLAGRIAGATLEMFDGAGHEAPITQPERVAASVLALADRIGW